MKRESNVLANTELPSATCDGVSREWVSWYERILAPGNRSRQGQRYRHQRPRDNLEPEQRGPANHQQGVFRLDVVDIGALQSESLNRQGVGRPEIYRAGDGQGGHGAL